MKRKLFGLLVCIAVLVLTASVTFAADQVVEKPDLKIVIDGKAGAYTDVPVIYNDSSMLPLRALLVNLGVKDDDKHILWNSAEKSITILHEVEKEGKKEPVKIYLQIGNTAASINNTAITLDAAPIIYKDKTYIPTRFVAQSLGKKVVWDGATSSVLVRDEKEFNKVKEIMDKSNTAMDPLTKMKFSFDAKVKTSARDMSLDSTAKGSGEFDRSKQAMHMSLNANAMGQNINTETYFANNAMYMKDPTSGKWTKTVFPEEMFKAMYNSSGNSALIKASDVIYAGLVIDETYNASDEILLKGNVYLDPLMKMTGLSVSNNEVKIDFDKVYMEIYINKSNYMANKVNVDIDMKMSVRGQQIKQSQKMTVLYNYSDDKFEIVVPEDVVKSATETKM